MTSIRYSSFPYIKLESNNITKVPLILLSDEPFSFVLEANCGRIYNADTFKVRRFDEDRSPFSLYVHHSRLTPHYLATIFNSSVGACMLFSREYNGKRFVTKQRLMSVPLCVPPLNIQMAVGKCNEILQCIDNLPDNFANRRLFNVIEKTFRQLQDLLVAEIYFQDKPAFIGKSLIGLWMPFSESLTTVDVNTIAMTFMAISRPESEIRSKIEVINTLLKLS